MSKADLLDRIEHERRFWNDLIGDSTEADLERPAASGAWTFKDVVGHLNGWRNRTVARLETAVAGEETDPLSWPEELDEETEEGLQAINQWIYERNRNRPAGEILAETDELFRRMRSAVESLSEADLSTPGRYPWLPDYPLEAIVSGTFEHLHDEHGPDIRAWSAG